MKKVHEGQCGLCVHFGETHSTRPEIVTIRSSKNAPEDLVDDCGHPNNAKLHLKVTPISGCEGFERAAAPLAGMGG